MGYSKNVITLQKIYEKLRPLEGGRDFSWIVPAGEADKWAYKVREGLYLAKKYRTAYPQLAWAADKFNVSVKSPTLVSAKRSLEGEPVAEQGRSGGREEGGRRGETGIGEGEGTVLGGATVFEIVQAVISHRDAPCRLVFPAAVGILKDDLLKIRRAAEPLGFSVALGVEGLIAEPSVLDDLISSQS